MTRAVSNYIKARPFELVREYYIERPMLFGLLKVRQVQRLESAGTVLGIICKKTPEKVILNGVEYKPV